MIKIILLVIGMVLLCGNVYGSIGYTEINLIDYKINNFIHVNSRIPLSNYTYELKTGRNYIGMPWNTTIYNADMLIKDIQPECRRVTWWNSTSQQLESYSKMFGGYVGTKFAVEPARGYEVSVIADTTWTIECLQPVNPILQYQCFNLNKYVGTNIVRVRNI